jgi:competence protein ComEA
MKKIIVMLVSTLMLFASVDINSATVKEFTSLKGVGEKKAQAIVEYRTQIKCFQSLDELVKVKGIGTKLLDKIKDELTLGECKK